jgi:hypothetical protein
MKNLQERNCQIRMSSSLWNLVGEIAHQLGYEDARGRHSTVIREMIAAAAAKWVHSPYVCRSARHTVYVTEEGNVFSRQVEILQLNSPREKLPCSVEMKPEKREYYHRKYRKGTSPSKEGTPKDQGEFEWFQRQWLVNHFAAWSGKKDADVLESFGHPLSSHVDTFGPTYKGADLAVHALGGRFLTREITVGLQDYVQWREPNTPIFDRIDIPIDIPTSNLEICVVVDLALFDSLAIQKDEIGNLALEFRNRETARFEGKEVALRPEIEIEEQYGHSSDDEGADQMLLRVRRLRQRISTILGSTTTSDQVVSAYADKAAIDSSLRLPKHFLFYWLRWPSPHLGIEACVRWEKPPARRGLSNGSS